MSDRAVFIAQMIDVWFPTNDDFPGGHAKQRRIEKTTAHL
jgi:hypothetical protein